MQQLHYPIVYYPLPQDYWLGLLVGTVHQFIDKDKENIKQLFKNHLQKEYKKKGIYESVGIEEAKMEFIKVKVQMSYKEGTETYPTGNETDVEVALIYGDSDSGHYKCFMPLWGKHFNYYQPEQLKQMAGYFLNSHLNSLSPEEVTRLQWQGRPTLDSFLLRVNEDREIAWGFDFDASHKTLHDLCTPYPPKQGEKKRASPLPDVAWELEATVEQTMTHLKHSTASILLVGEQGVGKSVVLRQAIKKFIQQEKKNTERPTFWLMPSQRLVASTKYLGEWQEKCETLIEELSYVNGVLWVSEFINLVKDEGTSAAVSVAAYMMPYMRAGKLRLIGELHPAELDKVRQLLPEFIELFQTVHLNELPEAKQQLILEKFAYYTLQNNKITLEKDAILLAYRLLKRYFPYQRFPGKGIQFLGKCISRVKLEEKDTVTKDIVVQQFSQTTGLPRLFLQDDILLNIKDLANYFAQRIIGQPNVIQQLCEVVSIFKAGLNNPNKPITTMLFTGPTGVGKTAAAKALANYFFGQGQEKSPLVRIDMSEYQSPAQLYRFIGIGNQLGELSKAVRAHPFCVLLLDEVEKADISIFDALMTVLDEGTMIDSFGRITNFRNTIVVMTSNLGASNQGALQIGSLTSETQHYLSAIRKHFRPEFVNRIDTIVPFKNLEAIDIEQITRKELHDLCQREGFTKRHLTLTFSERLIQHLARVGFDPRYGARPLQRSIEQTIIHPLAHWLLKKENPSHQTIALDWDGRLQIA
jgi:ATP-dependent Clp protease ATP-binding subunit ClpC